MLTCKKASMLVSRELDAKLGFAYRVQLRFHLMICSGCHNFQKQVTFLRQACRQMFAPDEKRGAPDDDDRH